MMNFSHAAFSAVILALTTVTAFAADYPAPKQGEWIARDFKFHTGETLSGAARLGRLGGEHADGDVRRRVVRSRPAAGCRQILHHHSGWCRPRQIIKTLRRHED